MGEPSVIIVEDDWIVANGLRAMLSESGTRVVGVVSRADRAELLVRQLAPALALVDIDLGRGGDGVDLARTLSASGVTVVFTSAHADEATLARVKDVGAAGFVVKPFSREQIRAALAVALARRGTSGTWLAAHVGAVQEAPGKLTEAITDTPQSDAVPLRVRRDPRFDALTERERAVLTGLVEHRRVPAIAEHLGISAHTVRNHLKSVFSKFRVSSQQELLDLILERPPAEDPSAPASDASIATSVPHPKVASAKRPTTAYLVKAERRRK